MNPYTKGDKVLTKLGGKGEDVEAEVVAVWKDEVQVKTPEESKYPWDYYKILAKVSGEEAFGPPDPACSLVKK